MVYNRTGGKHFKIRKIRKTKKKGFGIAEALLFKGVGSGEIFSGFSLPCIKGKHERERYMVKLPKQCCW